MYSQWAASRPMVTEKVRAPARASSLMSRHSLPCRIAATSSPTGMLTASALQSMVPVMVKNEPTTMSGPMSANTSGMPYDENLYWNGGAV